MPDLTYLAFWNASWLARTRAQNAALWLVGEKHRHADTLRFCRHLWIVLPAIDLSETCLLCPFSFCLSLSGVWHLMFLRASVLSQTQSNGQTDKRTDTRNRIWCNFNLKMWHLVAVVLTIFVIINWPNVIYLLVDPGFLPSPLNFHEASCSVPPPP